MRLHLLSLALLSLAYTQAAERPLFRDFVGLCGHTVQFKPELYQPVCRIVRDYHPVQWDLAADTSTLPSWPFAKNRVSWEKVYKSWHEKGLRISVCLQFDNMKLSDWKDLDRDAKAYAQSFAQHFGPGGKYPYVDTVEIGNEPGLWDDASYLRIYQAMAQGIRQGNPRMKIASCNAEAGPSDRYWKGADLFNSQLPQLDVLRIHRYAIKKGWPTWQRSYPEDSSVPYLSKIQDMLHWRDQHAAGREMWVSEFGWDCSTQKPDPKGDMAQFQTSTDEEQAKWLLRSYLLFAEMGVDKAFAYFFNDDDKPTFHGCSGITRNFQPKPSYHALAWMLQHLADYRFHRALLKSEQQGYLYEFTPELATAPRILVAWHPTQENVSLSLGQTQVTHAEVMPLTPGPVAKAEIKEGKILASTRPIFLWVEEEKQ